MAATRLDFFFSPLSASASFLATNLILANEIIADIIARAKTVPRINIRAATSFIFDQYLGNWLLYIQQQL